VHRDGHRRVKQALYLPEPMLEELAREAARQDRTESQLITYAWTIAREQVQAMPAAPARQRTRSAP